MRHTLALVCLAALAACTPPEAPPAASASQETPPVTRVMTWNDLESRPPVSATHAIQWGPGATNVADLWLPEGVGPFPVVLMVHGGCWQKLIADRTLMNWAAEDLRKQGLAVWNIEYRGVDEDGGGYPGTFLDVAHAADALRDQAAQYNLDLNRVAAFGHSAGGHLALWAAARHKLPANSPMRMDNPLKLVGVVNSGGLADLKASRSVTQRECLADIFDQLVGDISSTRAEVLSDTSPAEMLPLKVRQVSVNGHEDTIAPPVLGEGYTRRAKAAGDNADVAVVLNTGHVELISPGSEAWDIEASTLRSMLSVK
ncbi:MAG: alpha/beta hydrolase [Hyphomonadaceae bacterium]|nr:alpha/beta hydrolase [Hyphomonadaceae bacterium]